MYSKQYSLEDLIMDPDFVRWVKSPRDSNSRAWQEWIDESFENRRLYEEAREIISGFSVDEDEPLQQELSALWNRIEASNAAYDQSEALKRRSVLQLFPSFRLSRIAAAVTAFLVLSVTAWFYLNRDIENSTLYGQNKTVTLPDGSQVTLNANSSISYSPEWSDDRPREIWLKGEAFFSVTHKKNSQKFIVHTPDLDVQVLGTKFDVNTRRGKTRVILNSGKVKLFVKRADKQIEMKPGDLVECFHADRRIARKLVVPQTYSSWVDKRLQFQDASLQEIANLLEDNYGYKVRFLDAELSALTFTGAVDSGNTDLLLTILQKTFNISIIKKEGTISIAKQAEQPIN